MKALKTQPMSVFGEPQIPADRRLGLADADAVDVEQQRQRAEEEQHAIADQRGPLLRHIGDRLGRLVRVRWWAVHYVLWYFGGP